MSKFLVGVVGMNELKFDSQVYANETDACLVATNSACVDGKPRYVVRLIASVSVTTKSHYEPHLERE